MRLALRVAPVAVSLLVPSLAWACSLIDLPTASERLEGRAPSALVDAGSDATAPEKLVVSSVQVRLVRNGCDGSGASCPELDMLTLGVSVRDDQTPTERLRYVAFFGATAQAAATAPAPELLFSANRDAATTVSAWLGHGGARGGSGFSRATLCFALAAVDEAANVGERSDAQCVDTTDAQAATSTVVAGTPCGLGCGCMGTEGLPALALALLALARRRPASR